MSMHTSHRPEGRPPLHRLPTYWERTQWPLQSLYFLLPLLIGHELGTIFYTPDTAVLAESLLGRFFAIFGATGVYLPGLLVVLVLVAWHLQRKDPWAPEPRLLGGMFIETVILTMPLLVLTLVISREIAAAEAAAGLSDPVDGYTWRSQMVLSLGAGIYEELLFRLIGIAVLHLLLVDALALPEKAGAWIAVVGTAVAFALYHPFPTYNPMQWQTAQWSRFIFYTLAGMYFAGVYVLRGFGIVAAVHALYDVVVFSLRHWEL